RQAARQSHQRHRRHPRHRNVAASGSAAAVIRRPATRDQTPTHEGARPMSDQTRNALDTAIRAHIAAEAAEQGSTDDFVTHWAVVAGILPTDDGEAHWTEAPDGQ